MHITRRLLIPEEKQIFLEVRTYLKSSSEIFELNITRHARNLVVLRKMVASNRYNGDVSAPNSRNLYAEVFHGGLSRIERNVYIWDNFFELVIFILNKIYSAINFAISSVNNSAKCSIFNPFFLTIIFFISFFKKEKFRLKIVLSISFCLNGCKIYKYFWAFDGTPNSFSLTF